MSRRVRMVVLVAGIVLAAGALAYSALPFIHLYEPEVQIEQENYAVARARFQTRLTRRAGSPQRDVLALHVPEYVEVVTFPSNGLRLSAWLAGHHQSQQKLPAVIFLHGGFEFGAADWDMAVPFWEAGFVVMAPMLRGENGQPGIFTFLYDEVDDVLAAAAYLATHPAVRPDQIYLAGHSAGGTLTLLAIEASSRFHAAVAFDGSPDQQLLYNGSASKPGSHREVVFDAHDSRELQMRSPLAYASSINSPVRLFYSYEAAPLNKKASRRLAAIARRQGIDAKAVRVWGTHMTHVARAMSRSIGFFRERLGAETALLHPRTLPPPTPSLSGNTTFTLRGHEHAQVVALAGSFNGWDSQHYLCARERGSWGCRLDLPAGRHLYLFVVDNVWITDPDNPITAESGNGGAASVIVKR